MQSNIKLMDQNQSDNQRYRTDVHHSRSLPPHQLYHVNQGVAQNIGKQYMFGHSSSAQQNQVHLPEILKEGSQQSLKKKEEAGQLSQLSNSKQFQTTTNS